MRFHLISDNVDTIAGMKLAGIPGVLVHKNQETRKALMEAMEMEAVEMEAVEMEMNVEDVSIME